MGAHVVVTAEAADTRELGCAVAALCEQGDVLVLAGEMGAGKTTFVQGLARGLGITEPVVSPTFVIAREYEGRIPLLHVDVYRIDTLSEFDDIAVFETTDAVVVVEWGDAVSARLPSDRLEVAITRPAGQAVADDEREVRLEGFGLEWARRDEALARCTGQGARASEL